MAETAPYRPHGWDEVIGNDGIIRERYRTVLGDLGAANLEPVATRLASLLEQRGVEFISKAGREIFYLDLVPRIVEAAEWEALAAGLRQRAAALNEFIRDVYGERRIVADGRIPERVVASADHYEHRLAGGPLPATPAPIIGFDVVRGADGALAVLEDNTRTPSGFAYAVAAREALSDAGLPASPPPLRDPIGCYAALRRYLQRATPPAGVAIMLSDGPGNAAWFEHRELAGRLDLPLLTPPELRRDGNRLTARIRGEERPVGLIYRRTDEDRLFGDDERPTPLGELLWDAIVDGGVLLCNAFGSGIADDKLVYAYVEQMIRFYLDEEPLLRSVRSYDLGDDAARAEALSRLDELVVKPRAGLGGEGVVICAHADPADVRRIAAEIEAGPGEFIAQEMVELSTHPTVVGQALEPRHIDLRAYTLEGELVPAPLTRFARERGAMVVNSSAGGGAKDTWVLR